MQKTVTEFSSECGKAKIYVDNEMPIGVFHDFLMFMKGIMVDRMIAVHQEEMQEIERQKAVDAVKSSPDSEIV